MIVRCPHCGKTVMVNHLGRKPLELPVIKVYDALRHNQSVAMAASELCCSRAYIYKVLKADGLTPADIINGRVTEQEFSISSQGKGIDIIRQVSHNSDVYGIYGGLKCQGQQKRQNITWT